MANSASGSGTMILGENWTQEALEAFKPVLEAWRFYESDAFISAGWLGSYSTEVKSGQYTISVSIYGHYSCGNTIENLDEWTREWIREKPWTKEEYKRSVVSNRPLNEEQYERLLKLMHESNLKIVFDYVADGAEVSDGYHKEKYELTSDGEKLCCLERETSELTWDDLDESAFESVTSFFELFAEKNSKSKIEEWVRENIEPTKSMTYYDLPTDDNLRDYIEDIIDIDYDGFVEENLPLFLKDFTPDPRVWKIFNEVYEELCAEEFKFDAEDDMEDED